MLNIGVTGHRFLAQTDILRQSIDIVLKHIQQTFPDKQWCVWTSLAEGADCLITKHALALPNVSIHAVLPLPEEAFLQTFLDPTYKEMAQQFLATAADKTVLPPQPTVETAYRAAGRYIVEHADILIALWDGNPPQGIGGAGEAVAFARQLHKPLAWIKAGNRIPGTYQATSLGSEQGHIIYERFPSPQRHKKP